MLLTVLTVSLMLAHASEGLSAIGHQSATREQSGAGSHKNSLIWRAQLRMKLPKCGEHLEGTPSLPLAQIPLEFQMVYETDSGNECLDKGNVRMACEHFRRALQMHDQTYPLYANTRDILRLVVKKYSC